MLNPHILSGFPFAFLCMAFVNGQSFGSKFFSPERFSKLTLPAVELFGSRWILENKKRINVSHSIEIVDATLIHTNELTLRIEFNLRQMWNAHGLHFPDGLFKDEDPPGTFVTADYNVLKFMWSPDSYISTSRESNLNTVGMPLSLVYIFKNMSIIYKVRMFTKVGCSSSFQWYPMDIQTCSLVIESYKYLDDTVIYNWTPEHLYRPVVVHVKRLLQYELRTPIKYDSGLVARGGRKKKYAFVRLKFTFERRLGNNMIQVYTPTTLVVVLSWFSFWLGLDAIPGRISLLVTCMLTLVTMHSGIKSSIPPVHYITMMDVWMVTCMGFVFCAICEFVVVKYLHWRMTLGRRTYERMLEQKSRQRFYGVIEQIVGGSKGGKVKEYVPYPIQKPMNWGVSPGVVPVDVLKSIVVGGVGGETGSKDGRNNWTGEGNGELDKKQPVWANVDKICRFCVPLLFCFFNVVYWPVLLNGSVEQENLDVYDRG